jgi:hypothetical protein
MAKKPKEVFPPDSEFTQKTLLKSEITYDIYRISKVMGSGIFEPGNRRHPLRQSAFTEVIILLHDLLQKAKDCNVPVSFTDEVDTSLPDVNDITDLVAKVRNGVCHINSKNHRTDKSPKSTFNQSFVGDDLCFRVGRYKLLLEAHIIRAFKEVRQNLRPVAGQMFDLLQNPPFNIPTE